MKGNFLVRVQTASVLGGGEIGRTVKTSFGIKRNHPRFRGDWTVLLEKACVMKVHPGPASPGAQ